MAPMATAKTNQRTTKTNGFLKKETYDYVFPYILYHNLL